MPPTDTFSLYDRILNGTLEEKLRDWRNAGLSYAAISRELEKSGLHVHFTTIGLWARERGIQKPEKVG